jgi:hypothetical protein
VQIQNGGEYDFSDEKLQDTVGIKPPKLANQKHTVLGVAKRAELQGRNGLRQNPISHLVPLLEFKQIPPNRDFISTLIPILWSQTP